MVQVVQLLELVENIDHAKNYVDRIYGNYMILDCIYIKNKDYNTGLKHIVGFI